MEWLNPAKNGRVFGLKTQGKLKVKLWQLIVYSDKRGAFLSSNMVGLVAFNFVLRFFLAGAVGMAIRIGTGSLHLYNFAGYVARFRIQFHVVAGFKGVFHTVFFWLLNGQKKWLQQVESGSKCCNQFFRFYLIVTY